MLELSSRKRELKARLLYYDERIGELRKALLDLHPAPPGGSHRAHKYRKYDRSSIRHMRLEQELLHTDRRELVAMIEREYGRGIIRKWRKEDKERRQKKRAELAGGETTGEKIMNAICFWKK